MTEKSTAVLDIGYSYIEEDLDNSLYFNKYGQQDIKKTIDKYIELLTRTINTLTIVKDTIEDDEKYDVELMAGGDNKTLEIIGKSDIVDRYIGFGIAHYTDENRDDLSYSNEESSSDDNYDSNSDSNSYTKIDTDDSDDCNYSEED